MYRIAWKNLLIRVSRGMAMMVAIPIAQSVVWSFMVFAFFCRWFWLRLWRL